MEQSEKEMTRVTLVGTGVNVVLTVLKILAGVLGHSAAMLADGIHSLSDFVSDIVVLLFVWLSSREKARKNKALHDRMERITTIVIALLLLSVGVELLVSGVEDIVSVINGGELPAPEKIALWMALISIASKEAIYQYTVIVGRRIGSPVLMANAWHHRSDALSSVASALGIAGAIYLGEQWAILDPIVSCLISIFIVVIAVKMAMPVLRSKNHLTE